MMKRLLTYVWVAVFCLLILPWLWLISCIWPFRMGGIRANRIGHLALNTETFLRKKQLDVVMRSRRYIFIAPAHGIANQFLLDVFKRSLCIIQSRLLSVLFVKVIPVLSKCGLYESLPMECSEYKYFQRAHSSVHLSESEVSHCWQVLTEMGLPQGEKFVCIFARDSDYLQALFPDRDTSHHDYRNADIDHFIPAIEYLLQQNYWVVRLGSHVAKPISYQHERLIDYPFTSYRSEKVDIGLVYLCEFVLGTPSGICDVAIAMDKPFLGVNYTTFWHAPWGKRNLFIPKQVIRSGSVLPYYTLAAMVTDTQDIFYGQVMKEKYQIEYVENAPEDILAVTQEMCARVQGVWQDRDEDIALRRRYMNEFWDSNPIAGNVGTAIGSAWLKKNQHLYFKAV